jgi:hypothetical protein
MNAVLRWRAAVPKRGTGKQGHGGKHMRILLISSAYNSMTQRVHFDPREPYARLRRAFVYKHKPTRTPSHLTGRWARTARPVAAPA